jgi:hypothetical protein
MQRVWTGWTARGWPALYATLLHAPATETPLVVGIFGDWGTGKTS